MELMASLGALAAEYDVPIQTHLSETRNEVAWVKRLHPGMVLQCERRGGRVA